MSDTPAPRPHWLFKPDRRGPSCLCILELADGDYWVVDSPTGTYRAGHADRGKWEVAEEEYVAKGYVREEQAKAIGLIPRTWCHAVPNPEASARGRVVRVLALLILVAGLAALLAAVVPRLLTSIVQQ
jgi:hypothetical protein